MYKWFLAWRYLHTKLIVLVGVASVMLCVAMVLVVLSVMGGFLDTIRARSRGLHSEIVLEAGTLQGFPYYEDFDEFVRNKLPNVVRVTTPVIYTYGIFRVPATTYTRPARVFGIQQEDYVKVNDFGKGLHYERYYPGTTRLGSQRMPVAGFTETGELRLPAELEAANARWRAQESDEDEIAEFDDRPFEIAQQPYVTSAVPGPRVYGVGFGEPTYTGAERDGVIVGADLLNQRRPDGNFDRYLARGADVALTLMPLSPTGNPTGEPPVRWALRYVDDSRTGIFEIDSLCVYVDFDALQHKLAMDPQPTVEGGLTQKRANQLLIGLHEGVELNAARDAIAEAWLEFRTAWGPKLTEADERALGFVEVYTWEDLQRTFIAAVEKEKVLVTFLFGLISLVAAVFVWSIFYMIVEKKTRDVGILKSLGASSRGVAMLFIIAAVVIGVIGSVLGAGLGTVVVWYINDIQDLLASLHPGLRVWSPDVYSFDQIPNVVKPRDVFWVTAVAILACIAAARRPARHAGRVWPVEALRYE